VALYQVSYLYLFTFTLVVLHLRTRRPRRWRWAPAYAVLWSMVEITLRYFILGCVLRGLPKNPLCSCARFFTSWMPFRSPNQLGQSAEGMEL